MKAWHDEMLVKEESWHSLAANHNVDCSMQLQLTYVSPALWLVAQGLARGFK